MPQTAYTTLPAIGVAGTQATNRPATIVTKTAGEALLPGTYVVYNSTGLAVNPSAAHTAATRGGIVMRNMYLQNDGAYASGDSVDVMETGDVWVQTEGAAAMNGNAFIRQAAGAGGTQRGAVRHDADTASATALPGAYFRGPVLAATGITKLELTKGAN